MEARKTRNFRITLAAAAGAFALLAGGCQKAQTTYWTPGANDAPNPAAAMVTSAQFGLGASDGLGHQLFVDQSETRMAMAEMVYQMAAAEDGDLMIEGVFEAYEPQNQVRQVIVSGEQPQAAPVAGAENEALQDFED